MASLPTSIPSAPPVPKLAQDSANKVDDRVVKEVIENYYATAVEAGDSARTRAQSGYTIASAIAAAIVAAGALGGINDARAEVKVLGVMALVAWLAAAAFFMRAVAGKVKNLIVDPQPDANSFVHAVLANVRTERGAVNSRSAIAQVIAIIAICLTTIAVVLALFRPPSSPSVDGTIALSPSGFKQVKALCGPGMPTPIHGLLNPSDLQGKFTKIELADGTCAGISAVRLPSASIVAVGEAKPKPKPQQGED